jgi:hypothetical protein
MMIHACFMMFVVRESSHPRLFPLIECSDTISHAPQYRLALLNIVMVVDPQSIREQKRREIIEASVLGCGIGILDLGWVCGWHAGIRGCCEV